MRDKLSGLAFTAGKRTSLTTVRVIGSSAEGSVVRPMRATLATGRPGKRSGRGVSRSRSEYSLFYDFGLRNCSTDARCSSVV